MWEYLHAESTEPTYTNISLHPNTQTNNNVIQCEVTDINTINLRN